MIGYIIVSILFCVLSFIVGAVYTESKHDNKEREAIDLAWKFLQVIKSKDAKIETQKEEINQLQTRINEFRDEQRRMNGKEDNNVSVYNCNT